MRRIDKEIEGFIQEIKARRNIHIAGESQQLVTEIIQEVRLRGDDALCAYTKQFDQVDCACFRVEEAEITKALDIVDASFLSALEKAKNNIWTYHERQKRQSYIDTEEAGIIRGQLIRPLEIVGIYVPGGTAVYPSSVLMNVIPAKIAGVKRIVLVTPPSKQGVNPHVLAAAHLAGVDEIYGIGGAQAIAALAFGTESIPKVDKIVGPGNEYVALAKRTVYGVVDIDMHAGPSEIIVIADDAANPFFIAADLLSQAEHDTKAMSVCITTSKLVAERIETEVKQQLQLLPRNEIAAQSLQQYGAIITVPSIQAAIHLANEIAPEHLELHIDNPLEYIHSIKHAGSIFLGSYTPEVVGDYMAGPNHILPTSGTARFSSPLSVDDFVKKSSFLSYTKAALRDISEAISTLAEVEGLHAHAKAIEIRFSEKGNVDGKAVQTYTDYE
jgi:histidinol dehydrogenase